LAIRKFQRRFNKFQPSSINPRKIKSNTEKRRRIEPSNARGKKRRRSTATNLTIKGIRISERSSLRTGQGGKRDNGTKKALRRRKEP
jgi:hypothetical protein